MEGPDALAAIEFTSSSLEEEERRACVLAARLAALGKLAPAARALGAAALLDPGLAPVQAAITALYPRKYAPSLSPATESQLPAAYPAPPIQVTLADLKGLRLFLAFLLTLKSVGARGSDEAGRVGEVQRARPASVARLNELLKDPSSREPMHTCTGSRLVHLSCDPAGDAAREAMKSGVPVVIIDTGSSFKMS